MRIAGVTLERGRYPVIEGREDLASPCWKATASWLYLDADWNTRFPWGTSLCLRIGKGDPQAQAGAPGFTLDLNAPLGEPNRLYFWLPSWHGWISLPQLRTMEMTGPRTFREVPQWPPHLPDGKWLTLRRTRRDEGQ